jgi:hypothetical protein
LPETQRISATQLNPRLYTSGVGFSDGELEGDELPVRPDGYLEFVCAEPEDKAILPSWVDAVRDSSNPVRRDAVELAGMAFKKWREARSHREVADTLEDLQDFVRSHYRVTSTER